MRVNLFGGPCTGKSTLALWLTCELRKAHIQTEFVDEWIKRWAYEKRKISGWDQYNVFSNQLEKEDFFLRHGVSIVSDSPLLLQLAYMKKYDSERFIPVCLAAAMLFEEDYPSINIFLERGKLPYDGIGRWETHEEALEMDKSIKSTMEHNLKDFYEFDTTDWDAILNEVFVRLKCNCC